MKDTIMKFIETNRLHLIAGAAVIGLVACGGDGVATVAPNGNVAGTDVPLAATVDSQAAVDFIASIVNAGGSETADPLIVGDVTLATSDTDEPDPRI
jgi:hypothetical protein